MEKYPCHNLFIFKGEKPLFTLKNNLFFNGTFSNPIYKDPTVGLIRTNTQRDINSKVRTLKKRFHCPNVETILHPGN